MAPCIVLANWRKLIAVRPHGKAGERRNPPCATLAEWFNRVLPPPPVVEDAVQVKFPGGVHTSPLAAHNTLVGKVLLANARDRHRYHPNGPYYYGVESLRKARCFAVGLWMLQTFHKEVCGDITAATERLVRGQ